MFSTRVAARLLHPEYARRDSNQRSSLSVSWLSRAGFFRPHQQPDNIYLSVLALITPPNDFTKGKVYHRTVLAIPPVPYVAALIHQQLFLQQDSPLHCYVHTLAFSVRGIPPPQLWVPAPVLICSCWIKLVPPVPAARLLPLG